MKFKKIQTLKKAKDCTSNTVQMKNKNLVTCLAIGILLISASFSSIIPFASAEHATVDILADSQVFSVPVGIVVTDTTVGGDTVQVLVTTNNDSVGITHTLTKTLSGDFAGSFINFDPDTLFANLVLMNGDNKFSLGTSIIISYDDPFLNETPSPDVVPTTIVTSGGNVVFLDLVETGDETGIFEGQITFVAPGSSGSNILEISEGEVFFIIAGCAEIVNGQIIPIPEDSIFGAVQADRAGDTLTVTYGDSSHIDTSNIDPESLGGCGGSGGGLVINRVVLDVLAGGTSGGDFIAPQLIIPKINLSNLPLIGDFLDFILNADPFTPITPLDDPSIDYPLSINGNGYLLTQYANTIETYTGKTGEPISFKMTLFDATGIEHIALYTNLRGDHREISDSDTYLIYNEDEPLEITDPNGFFSYANFTESEYNGKYIANFNMTFAKPMDTSDVIVRTWDGLGNSGDIKIFDALKIEGDPIVNPDTNNLIVPDSAEIVIQYYKLPYYEIPNADSEGNLIYYNSFGGLEEKQVHPYYNPIIYPDNIGKAERHDEGFNESVIMEEMKAHQIAKTIINNPFQASEYTPEHFNFFYPNNVGKLDRENKEMQKDIMKNEHIRAVKIASKLYKTNHLED